MRLGDLCFSNPSPDKNFEDDDSVDGGRSSSSSKGASQCSRKPVSMGSFRRPSSAKAAGGKGKKIFAISQYWPSVMSQRDPIPFMHCLDHFLIMCPVNDVDFSREAGNRKCFVKNNLHLFVALLAHVLQGEMAPVLGRWTRTTSSRPSRTCPRCR